MRRNMCVQQVSVCTRSWSPAPQPKRAPHRHGCGSLLLSDAGSATGFGQERRLSRAPTVEAPALASSAPATPARCVPWTLPTQSTPSTTCSRRSPSRLVTPRLTPRRLDDAIVTSAVTACARMSNAPCGARSDSRFVLLFSPHTLPGAD